MSRFFCFGLFVISAPMVSLGCTDGKDQSPPPVDLGDVWCGVSTTISVSVKSAAETEDRIVSVVGSCSCVDVQFPSHSIGPHKDFTLDVTISAKPKREDVSRLRFLVTFSSGFVQEVEGTFKRRSILTEPGIVLRRKDSLDAGVPFLVRLKSNLPETMHIRADLKVEGLEIVGQDRTLGEIGLTLVSGAENRLGPAFGIIDLRAFSGDGELVSMESVPFEAEVRGRVNWQPHNLLFDPGDDKELAIIVTPVETNRIEGIVCVNCPVVLSTRVVERDGVFRILVTEDLQHGQSAALVQETIRLAVSYVGGREVETIDVPIAFVRQFFADNKPNGLKHD